MDLESYLEKPDTWLVDVRTKEDYDLYHIEGARNLPFNQVEEYVQYLPKDKKYILYCESGSTSLIAAKKLSQSGFLVYSVIGGLRAWDEQRLN